MATLLFNSNNLFILLHPESQLDALSQSDEIYSLLCSYVYWPVTDLYKEWGIHDFPATTALWAVSFLACPSVKNQEHTEDSRIRDEELYWITLHPTTLLMEPIEVLCFADSDRQFFGVVVNHEETVPLLTLSNLDRGEAWLQVMVKNITRIKAGETNSGEEITAELIIHGESFVNWTKAMVEPIFIKDGRTKNCWENVPKNRRSGSQYEI